MLWRIDADQYPGLGVGIKKGIQIGPRLGLEGFGYGVFTERATSQKPVAIFGDGEQTRDFVYVKDLVSILVQAVEVSDPKPGAVNVGLSRSTSLNDLIAELGDATGMPMTVSYQAARQGDIRHSRANNTRLLDRFKLAAPTSIGDGLAQLLRSL